MEHSLATHATASTGLLDWAIKTIVPLLVPSLLGLVAWEASQLHKANVIRSAFLAQLKSLSATLSQEKEYVGTSGKDFTWFPMLDMLTDAKQPLSAAGIISAREVASIVRVFYAYREGIAYIARYGQVSSNVPGADNAIGVNIGDGGESREWCKNDLSNMEEELGPALQSLELGLKLGFAQQWAAWFVIAALFTLLLYLTSKYLHA